MGRARSIDRTDWSQKVCGTLLDGFAGQVHEHRGLLVTNPVNLARRYLHLFAGKPVAGLDDQLTNRPALVVHHKIADVADRPITCLEVVAVHGLRVPQMSPGTFGLRANRTGCFAQERFGWQLQDRKAAHTPQRITLPVAGPAVISAIL